MPCGRAERKCFTIHASRRRVDRLRGLRRERAGVRAVPRGRGGGPAQVRNAPPPPAGAPVGCPRTLRGMCSGVGCDVTNSFRGLGGGPARPHSDAAREMLRSIAVGRIVHSDDGDTGTFGRVRSIEAFEEEDESHHVGARGCAEFLQCVVSEKQTILGGVLMLRVRLATPRWRRSFAPGQHYQFIVPILGTLVTRTYVA